MNQTILRTYYEMQGKIILPEAKDNNDIALAATVAANFASIGFPLTTDQTKELAKADKEDIMAFYKDNYEMFASVIGAGKQPKPFYPDFPDECMDKSHAEYFIDQVIYGLSGLQLEPSVYRKEKKRFPFIGEPMRRIPMTGSKEDLDKVFKLAVHSAIAYSREQRAFIMAYIKEFPEAVQVLLDNTTTKNRENAVACAMMVEDLSGNAMHTMEFMKQPADMLRYAAFKSVQKENTLLESPRDPYEAIALRDDAKKNMPGFSLGRKERTFIMDGLADMDKGSGERLSMDMHGHNKEWGRLFKKLHISDKAWKAEKYANVKRAIVIIQGNESIDCPARRIEEAIKSENVEEAVKETIKKPGEFMRRFDKLYRMSLKHGKEQLVLDAMKEVSVKAGIATVSGAIGNIELRDHDEEERFFKNKQGLVVKNTEKNRKAFTQQQIKDAVDIAMAGMSEKFKGKEPIGKVYMSETLKDVKIPVDIRDSSNAIGSMTSGSKMPLADDWQKMRFFVSWTNMKNSRNNHSRIDIDLSVMFCDSNMKVVDLCGWNSSYNGEGYVYSGDVQDGGPASGDGRAEYIDLDIKKLVDRGIVYVVPQVNSFTGQDFSEQPNTCFGVMKRTDKDMGKAYEPASVVNRFVLDVEATQTAMYIINLKDREILWLNAKMQERVASRALYDTLKQVRHAANSKTMTLNRLVEANTIATGEFTHNPQKADRVFVRDADEMQSLKEEFDMPESMDDKFILSNNMEYITGYLMQEATKEQKKMAEKGTEKQASESERDEFEEHEER